MKLKRFPENDYHHTQNSYLEATQGGNFTSIPELVPKEQNSINYSAPTKLPPRKGRKAAFTIIACLLGYSSYNLWNSYLRYDSFGVVESDIIGVYTTNPGIVKTLKVSEGSIVNEGDLIARVESSEDLRQLAKNTDEMQVAQAELIAKKEEIHQKEHARLDNLHQVEMQIADTSASIIDLKSRLAFQRGEVSRYSKLHTQGAAGAQELESARAQLNSSTALVEGKALALSALRERLTAIQSQHITDSELKPIEAKIAFLDGERKRMLEKIEEGKILSPASGMVSSIKKKPGELVNQDPILTLVVDNTANLVLYYDAADKLPKIGTTVQVMIPSLGKMVDSKVTSISKDVSDPPDQIKTNYRINQKLVKVYLDPKMADEFVVGSVIKRPNPTDLIKESLNLVYSAIPSSFAYSK